ncbi:MAG TPA: cytochrome c peroxidase [Nitrospiraceae bacterium]|nr:cytochrome c peroxidase [Nitrospiraceae bacterium]
MKIQPEGAAMKPVTPKIELPPSTQLRKAVFEGSHLLGKSVLGVLAICAVTVLSSWIATPEANAQSATEYKLKIPFGLEETAVVIPADNPLTNEKVELGRLLAFDKRLSEDNTIACMSCHLAKLAFTDGKPVATGIRGQRGGRSAPASFNRVFSSAQFWDGRAETLEAQSVGPFTNPIEHGFANYDVMRAKMMKIAGYRKLFKQAFGEENITIDNVGKAIASFQRTILSGNSPADRFDQGQEEGAISAEAQHGLLLFREKARCTKCHSGFNFTDEKFHNLGIGWDDNKVDLGRYMVTKNPEDIGAFKTPTLREIARSGPYTHDGRFKTLEEVVNFYNQGGVKNPHQDPLIIPLELTGEEKRDLVQFLRTLNGEGWQQVKAPNSFPR